MPISRKSEEARAAAAAQKEQRRRAQQQHAHAEAIEKAHRAFLATPAGQARIAFERAAEIFQYSLDVMNQQAIVVAMVGSTTSKKTTDPTDVLNSVCREGWELVNGSFVFVEQGQQSRDKFMTSGQNVATKGAVVGYYLFKRNEDNRRTPAPPPARHELEMRSRDAYGALDERLGTVPQSTRAQPGNGTAAACRAVASTIFTTSACRTRSDGRRRAAVLATASGLETKRLCAIARHRSRPAAH